MSQNQYQKLQKKRENLINIIERLLPIVSQIKLEKKWKNRLNILSERIKKDNFKILVLGEFKRGKSTFINGLLGQEILPAYTIPTTAIINEVKWSPIPHAYIHYKQPKTGKKKPPLKISADKETLHKYVTIQEDNEEKDTQQKIYENSYEKVELFWPLSLCRDGVEIIDSPGLNEHETRQKVTINYANSVDVILFVISCEILGSQTELSTIENLRSMGYQDLFFICNRFNMVGFGRSEEAKIKEQEKVKRRAINCFSDKTKAGQKHIFFINALGGLQGRIENNDNKIKSSGILQVEKELENFLINEKGRIKICRPAIELKTCVREAKQTIPARRKMLQSDIKSLELRYEKSKKPLEKLRKKQQIIILEINNFRQEIEKQVNKEAEMFYNRLPDKVSQWIESYQFKEPVKLPIRDKSIQKAITELSEHLSLTIEKEFNNWQEQKLQSLIRKKFIGLQQRIDKEADDFFARLERLRNVQVAEVADNLSAQRIKETEVVKKVGFFERVFAGAAGFMIGGLGAGGVGVVFGYQEMLKSLIPQIAIAGTAILMAGFNPFVLIPMMTAGGFFQALNVADGVNQKIKEKVKQEYMTTIAYSARENSQEIAKTIASKLEIIEIEANKILSREIKNLTEQMESVLAEKKKGQKNVQEQLKLLETLEKDLASIDSQIDFIITKILGFDDSFLNKEI